jgi:hypothetical protein
VSNDSIRTVNLAENEDHCFVQNLWRLIGAKMQERDVVSGLYMPVRESVSIRTKKLPGPLL